MAMELPDGKTARTIQEQVKFLTEKLKDLYARVNNLEVKIVKVDELPAEGEFGTIYLLPVEDPEEGNYFEEYIYFDGEWELIGTTQVDLSGYVDLTSAQTITGVKTFSNGIIIEAANASNYKIVADNGYYLDIQYGGTTNLSIQYEGILNTKDVRPFTSNNYDLGTSSTKWRDLYLSGKVIFTSDAYIDYSSSAIHIHNLYNTITINEGGTVLGDTCQAKDIQPISNNSFNLGTSSYVWNYAYINNLSNGTGTLYSHCDFLPSATNVLGLGNSSYAWKYVYVSNTIHGTSTYLAIDAPDATTITLGGSEIQVNADLNCNGNKNLGDSSKNKYWNNLYLSGNLSDGTNSVSVAQIASGLGGTYRHRIDIECSGEDLQINVNLNTNTSITTLALLDSIKDHLLGMPILLDAQGSYRYVMLNNITVNVGAGTATFEIWDNVSPYVHTLTFVDFYQDTIYQL